MELGHSTLVLFLSVALQAGSVEQPAKAVIEGTVTISGSGAPLSQVEIIVSERGSQSPIIVKSDASGHFVVDELEPGRYFLRAGRDGYLAQNFGQRGKNREGTALVVTQGQKLRDVDFKLVATGVIAGRVSGEDNEPRVGASVQAFAFHYVEGERRLITAGEVSTNDLGEYRIYGLAPGRYYVNASEQERYHTVSQPKGGSQEERYTSTFYPNADNPRQATVVDVASGQEVRGIDVKALRSRTFHIRGRVIGLSQTTHYTRISLHSLEPGFEVIYRGRDIAPDGEGNFDLGGIFPGAYVLSAIFARDGKGYRALQQVVVGNDDVNNVNLAPSSGVELRGSVHVDSPERDREINFSNVRVDLSASPSFSEMDALSARTNVDGSFRFQAVNRNIYSMTINGLPEDFYVKLVRLGGEEMPHRTVDLNSVDGTTKFEIVVSPSGGRIQGIVTNEKSVPIGGALVALVPDSDHRQESYLFKEATADPDGHFSIRAVTPGDYKLFAWEDVESGEYQDPEFLKTYEDKGQFVRIQRDDRKTVELRIIPTGPPAS